MTNAAIYRRWVVACTAGEVIGFGAIPVALGVTAWLLTGQLQPDIRAWLLYALSVAGGVGEGAVLAWFQLRVLSRCFPGINRRRWILFTAVAAAFAWSCGMLAPTLDEAIGLSVAAQAAIWIPASVLILLSIGTAQGYVLADVTGRPLVWVAGNVAGWLLGLPWTFVLPSLVPVDAPIGTWVATFVTAGVLMGLTVGAVTGVALLQLLGGGGRQHNY